MEKKKLGSSVTRRKTATNTIVHIFLAVMCVVWLLPLVWIILHSFRGEPGQFVRTLLPKTYTLENYKRLFTETGIINFPRMFLNTLFIATCSCLLSTFFVLSVSYCTSRLRFKFRKPYMNIAMILNLFPGFMSMIAVYFILKAFGLTEGAMIPFAMILCFSAGAGTGFYIVKGYMDTIPKALDEAAYLDGATRWQTFTKITLPMCKPIIVYQLITSFMGPWLDFVMAKLIAGANAKYFTVSIGLWNMMEKEYVYDWFTRFAAGAVLVSIPIATLFLYTQKFYQEAMSGSVKG
ncbi:MAG: ABC transporter permease subunit [Oscillospiraceae bacterium]|nr:ABC transporter permease subunit [Oscillospiraceae bacterium]